MPRSTAPRSPTPVRPILLSLAAVSVLSICGPGCFAEAPIEPPQEPEIPSREEVFESNRRQEPASASQMAALSAYREKVCAPRPEAARQEEPRRRGCIIRYDPMLEITALEKLLKESA